MGLGAGLDRRGKSRPHRDSIPGPFHPVARRYTDYAIAALYTVYVFIILKHESLPYKKAYGC